MFPRRAFHHKVEDSTSRTHNPLVWIEWDTRPGSSSTFQLNAQFGLTVHLGQVVLENRFRDVDGGEDIRNQTDNERNGETADGSHGSRPENTQKGS